MLENNQLNVKPGPVSLNGAPEYMITTNVITHQWDAEKSDFVELADPIVVLKKLKGSSRDYEVDDNGNYVHRSYCMPLSVYKPNHREL